jgi:hypothetical protein
VQCPRSFENHLTLVIPAKAGIHPLPGDVDPRLRGGDEVIFISSDRPQAHGNSVERSRQQGEIRKDADRKTGPSPCLLESYGRQAKGYGPAFRSVRAGRPQGGGPRYLLRGRKATPDPVLKGCAIISRGPVL